MTQHDLLDALTQRYLKRVMPGSTQRVPRQTLDQFQTNLVNSPQTNTRELILATRDVLLRQGRLSPGTDVQKFEQQLLAWVDKVVATRVRHQAPIPSRFPIVRSMKSTTWRCAEKFR